MSCRCFRLHYNTRKILITLRKMLFNGELTDVKTSNDHLCDTLEGKWNPATLTGVSGCRCVL